MALKYSVSDIYNALLEKISKEVNEASGSDEKLAKIIEKYNLFEDENEYYYDELNAKILIVGNLCFPVDALYSIAKKEFGIERDRIKLLDFQEAKHFDYQSLKGYSEFSDIIIGPNAHKAKDIGNYNSVISMIQAEQDKYPLLTLAQDSTGELKFSKTSFRNAMMKTKVVKKI